MNNIVNLLIPFHFGDIFTVCGFREEFERKYNVKAIFNIKPEHEIIMKLFGISDYKIKEFRDIETSKYADITEKQFNISNTSEFVCLPKKKDWEDFYANKINMRVLFAKALLLDENARWKSPTVIPELTEELKNKLKNIAPLNKICLFSPECFAAYPVVYDAYKDEIAELLSRGYTVISSVKDKKSIIPGTKYIPLDFTEALIVAINCAGVYCIRSGFTDVVIEYVDKITIYYPDRKTYNLFNFNYIPGKSVREIIVQEIFKRKILPCLELEKTNFTISVKLSFSLYSQKEKKHKIVFSILGIPVLLIRKSDNLYGYFLFGFIKIYERKKV